jgi:putative glycosyltransferase
MTRRYVDSLITHREHEPVFAGLAALTGYRQKSCLFDKASKNSSAYGLMRKLDLLANSVASFSNRPLNFIFYLGLFITASALVMVLFYLGSYLVLGSVVSGWTSLIVSLWVLGGVIILSLGIIGIYLAKMFSEVKDRPYTVIRSIYRGEP